MEAWAIYLIMLMLPCLAFFHIISLWVFHVVVHECLWTSLKRIFVVLAGLVLLMKCVLVSIWMTESSHPTTLAVSVSVSVPIGVVANTFALALLWWNYVNHLRGPIPLRNGNRMKGRVVLITGANGGIGYETARQLWEMGATVVMACRNEAKARNAIDEIVASGSSRRNQPHEDTETEAETDDGRERLVFLPLDLSSLHSVRKASAAFLALDLPLHVLINNAGVMLPQKQQSADGYELMMACNHLGHFLLTHLLLPKLRESGRDGPASRVITLSSCLHFVPSQMDLNDLFCEGTRSYTLFGQYGMSKLANVLFTRELARRERERVGVDTGTSVNTGSSSSLQKTTTPPMVYAVSVHPGNVMTNVHRNLHPAIVVMNDAVSFLDRLFLKSTPVGAYTSVHCASSEKIDMGAYYADSQVQPVSKAALDNEAAFDLWRLSEELVELKKDDTNV